MNDYYILKGKKVVSTDLVTWAKWFGEPTKHRVVKQTTLKNGRWVSTVFLGLDHSFGMGKKPILFETMVFPDRKDLADLDMAKCSTWKEAETQHKEMVKKWQKEVTKI
jgi:hypothetical protein